MIRSAAAIFFACFSILAEAQTQSVKLAWISIPDAVSYQVEIAAAKHPERVLLTRNPTISQLAVELPPGIYIYKVRAVAGDSSLGPWSDVQTFKVKPSAIEIVSPAAETVMGRDQVMKFVWKGDAGVSYRIQIVDPSGKAKSGIVKEPVFRWRGGTPGVYKWRVAYLDMEEETWAPYRLIQVTTKTASQLERRRPAWSYQVWGGLEYTSFDGDFAETFNHVTATTISDVYSGIARWMSPDLPDYRMDGRLDLRHQSLVRSTKLLPALAVRGARLWPLHAGRIGPFLEVGERQEGLFMADAYKDYTYDAVWRTQFKVGVISEFKVGSRIELDPYLSFGTEIGGSTGLGGGSIKPSTLIEVGTAASLLPYSRWKIRLRYDQQSLEWTGQVGDNKLKVSNIIVDAGVTL